VGAIKIVVENWVAKTKRLRNAALKPFRIIYYPSATRWHGNFAGVHTLLRILLSSNIAVLINIITGVSPPHFDFVVYYVERIVVSVCVGVLCVFTKNIAQKPVEGRETVEEAFSCTPPEIKCSKRTRMHTSSAWITFQKP
jgi:hypothetical protein